MTARFAFASVAFVFCVSCLAEELPSVPELLKKMYDYRMSIENMRAEVTVMRPTNTKQPHVEKMTQKFSFAYDKGRVRCDMTYSTLGSSNVSLYQKLSTPEFYVVRQPFPRNLLNNGNSVPVVNNGNSLSVRPPLAKPFDTLDPRRIGTDWRSIDTIDTTHFNYDTLLDTFYNPKGENYSVSIDVVDGENLYKVSFQVSGTGGSNSYWIDPQKGYNLVRANAETESLGKYISYDVTLGKFAARERDIWFPQRISYKHRVKTTVSEEDIVVDSIAFDVEDDTPFTLAGLEIPVGYLAAYHIDDEGSDGRVGGAIKQWDGKELVDKTTFSVKPVRTTSGKTFWIFSVVGFAIIALWMLIKIIKLFRRRSN